MNKQWHGKSVLIVDDSATAREEIARAFTAAGLRVVGEAVNGVEALKLIQNLAPDIVSLDIVMPEMDGIECYRKIMQQYPAVKCMIVSWLGNEPKVLESLASQVPSHLFQGKPVSFANIESRLDLLFNPPKPIGKRPIDETIDLQDFEKVS